MEQRALKVKGLIRREIFKRTFPPYITSSLQQEASRRLGYTARRTMALAQQLYEGIDVGGDGPIGLREGYEQVMDKLKLVYASPSGTSNAKSDVRRMALALDTLRVRRETADLVRSLHGGTADLAGRISAFFDLTGGGIRRARELLGDGTFCVVNGDALFAPDLRAAAAAHRASGAIALTRALPAAIETPASA